MISRLLEYLIINAGFIMSILGVGGFLQHNVTNICEGINISADLDKWVS